jgi:AraC family transcriptional regulator
MIQNDSIAIDHSQESVILQAVPAAQVEFSGKTQLNGIYLESHHSSAHETPEHYPNQHVIAIQTQGVVQSERRLDGEFRRESLVAGDVCIVPANTRHWIRWRSLRFAESTGEQNLLLISFEPTFLKQLDPEVIDPDRIEILPHFAKSDPLIYQLGRSLKIALENDSIGSRIYAESLSNALAAHLIHHYSTTARSIETIRCVSHPQTQQAIDYIDAHLTEDLSLAAIATSVGLSQFHLARIFKQTMGISLWQYVVQQRIDLAKRILTQLNLSIVEVSNYLGFSSQAQFTNFFRKHTGINPTQYRKKL